MPTCCFIPTCQFGSLPIDEWTLKPNDWSAAPNASCDLDYRRQELWEDARLLTEGLKAGPGTAEACRLAFQFIGRTANRSSRQRAKDITFGIRWGFGSVEHILGVK